MSQVSEVQACIPLSGRNGAMLVRFLTSAPLAVGDAASLRDCQLPPPAPAQLQYVSLSWALSASPSVAPNALLYTGHCPAGPSR